jgi:hypothetical protein
VRFKKITSDISGILDRNLPVAPHQRTSDWHCGLEDSDQLTVEGVDLSVVQ